MTTLHDIPTPALIVDLDRLETNIGRMAEKTRRLGVALRPHIKTHKCIEVARLQQAAGCRGLTVSTLYEARVFADHGFEDLTWAFPVIVSRVPEARRLAERITLRLVVDSPAAVELLAAERFPFHVWLKVDCGYHRAGVDPEGPLAAALVRRLQDSGRLLFDGLLTHSGHAYKAGSRRQLIATAEQERAVMARLADRLRSEGLEVPGVSVGSTPAMSVVENLDGIDEARPGNYVYFDRMQSALGACRTADCAVTVLTSVVSSQPQADHCVVDAGALAMSKDAGPVAPAEQGMGAIFQDYEQGLLDPHARLTVLSQEHGIVNAPLGWGTRIRVLPNHSCLSVACFDQCVVVRGERVVDRWRIWNGREGPDLGLGQSR